jgi:hypothetical protein
MKVQRWEPGRPPMRSIPIDERATLIAAAYREQRISLAEALQWCIVARVPIPEGIGEAVWLAFESYDMGHCRDLAEPFGIAELLTRRKQSTRPKLTHAMVKQAVDAFHADGWPLSPVEGSTETAFHLAAEQLRAAPSTVRTYYYDETR